MQTYDDDTKKFLMEFNKRLIKLRKDSGYSFKQLELLTGISHSTLQRYEANPEASISMSKVNKIADAYKVPASYLMGHESKELPYDYYKSIVPLLKECGYNLTFHSSDESFTLDKDDASIQISTKQIKELKDTIFPFFKFKLNEILDKPPTTE